ncbi:MAG: YigZ family protein [Bacteroidales bacterium]|nr:YigZ family protein [Bacteroidales bacterium]
MFSDTYHTLNQPGEGLYKDKGSKFIAYAHPVKNEEEIKGILDDLRKKHYDARHHCYAWALGPTRDAFRINDDGEPSGTAGKPIYGQILSHDITNVLIVVVRYFGGTKLGVRGLINAYKAAAAEAIENNAIVEMLIREVYELQFEYPLMNDVMKVLKDHDLNQLSHDFALSCKLTFEVRKNKADEIKGIFQAIYGVKITYLHTL